MRVHTVFAAGAIAAAAMTAAAAASAAVYTATYTGTVSYSSDLTGAFGHGAGADVLDGLPFTARFTYDTGVGVRTTVPGSSDVLQSGAEYGTPASASVVLTIGGVAHAIAGTYEGFAQAQGSPGPGQNGFVAHGAGDLIYAPYLQAQNYIVMDAYSSDVLPSLDHMFGPDPVCCGFGEFGFATFTPDGGYATDVTGSLDIATIQVGEVPEPAAWSLMTGGLWALGAALRRRRAPARA